MARREKDDYVVRDFSAQEKMLKRDNASQMSNKRGNKKI